MSNRPLIPHPAPNSHPSSSPPAPSHSNSSGGGKRGYQPAPNSPIPATPGTGSGIKKP